MYGNCNRSKGDLEAEMIWVWFLYDSTPECLWETPPELQLQARKVEGGSGAPSLRAVTLIIWQILFKHVESRGLTNLLRGPLEATGWTAVFNTWLVVSSLSLFAALFFIFWNLIYILHPLTTYLLLFIRIRMNYFVLPFYPSFVWTLSWFMTRRTATKVQTGRRLESVFMRRLN